MKRTNKNKRENKNNKTLKGSNKYKIKMFPLSKKINDYYIPVSSIHTIYVSTYGNKNGTPILYVHGGPGGNTNKKHSKYFDPKRYYIILIDQRGCGKSTPNNEIKNNTTMDLINDFELVRNKLNISKWILCGGSWGSTLSLAYAIEHPNVVIKLVISGIFLCSNEEIYWTTEPNGASYFNPEAWDYYVNALPNKDLNKLYIDRYTKCFEGKYGKKHKDKCLLAWSVWENSLSSINQKPLKDVIKYTKNKTQYKDLSIIENHYFTNNCFLKNNYFHDDNNIKKIKNIPITIIQGIYDLECPFINAYRLHKLLPNSKLIITHDGHSILDHENLQNILYEINK